MKIKCIAVDDEPLALSKLESFINEIASLELIKCLDNAIEAASFLRENQVDLIFLDIQMKNFTGIQFLESVHQRPQVIIISAYEQFALKGFELNVTDYLLKPYTFERLMQAVDKALELHLQKLKAESAKNQHSDNFIFVKTEYRLERVDFDDILYIEGMNDYLMIITKNQKIMTLQSFKNMEELLPSPRFLRIHKSFIVAIDKIKSIERNIININNQIIPLSNTYKERFYSVVKKNLN